MVQWLRLSAPNAGGWIWSLVRESEWLRWQGICLPCWRPRFNPWVRKIPWRGEWQPIPVFSPGEFHGQRSLVGYSLWGHKESNTTEKLTHTQTHASKELDPTCHNYASPDLAGGFFTTEPPEKL